MSERWPYRRATQRQWRLWRGIDEVFSATPRLRVKRLLQAGDIADGLLIRAHSGSMSREAEHLRRSWMANAEAWTEAVRNREIESRRLVTDAVVVAAVLEQKPARVLDAGCGEGWLVRALASPGVIVTGFDASPPLIEAARELGGGEFHLLGYEDLVAQPGLLPARSFDVIVANFALFDEDLQPLLRTFRDLLREGGCLVVQSVHPRHAGVEPYTDGWRTETFAAFPGHWPEAMPWFFRTVESWGREFAAAGFGQVETREPMHPLRGVPASIVFIARD